MSQISGPGVFFEFKADSAQVEASLARVNAEMARTSKTTDAVGSSVGSAAISIGKIASTLALAAGTATTFYTIGNRITDWFLAFDNNTGSFTKALDFGKAVESAKALSAELSTIANQIAEAESGSIVDSIGGDIGGNDGLAKLYERRKMLEGQQDAIVRSQNAKAEKDAEEAAKKQHQQDLKNAADLATKRKDAELAAIAATLPLVDDREKIYRQFVIERAKLEQQLSKETDSVVRGFIQQQIESAAKAKDEALAKELQARERVFQREEEDAKRLADIAASAMGKAMEKALSGVLDKVNAANSQTNAALTNQIASLNTNVQTFANAIRASGNTSAPRGLL